MSGKEPPPRNYFAIDFEDREIEHEGNFQDHDRFHPALLTGVIELEIEVLAPVHVGSGAYGMVDGKVVKELARREGAPIIPGSSLKGICRLTHEVLTYSASPFDEKIRKTTKPSRSGALFGLLGFASRISFDDAVSVKPVEPIVCELSVPYSPQKNVGRRFYGRMPAGANQPRTIPALAIPVGTVLRARLRFRNVLRDELGSVLLSLGVDRFTPKIGGAKYDPLGWVRFRPVGYRLRSPLRFAPGPWQKERGEVEKFYRSLIEAFPLQPRQRKSILERLAKELQAPPAAKGAAS